MEKKILCLDCRLSIESFAPELITNMPTTLTTRVKLAEKMVEDGGCGLIIVEPHEFNPFLGKDSLIPLLEKCSEKSIIRIVYTTLQKDDTNRRLSVGGKKYYDILLQKQIIRPQKFYQLVRHYFNKSLANTPTP